MHMIESYRGTYNIGLQTRNPGVTLCLTGHSSLDHAAQVEQHCSPECTNTEFSNAYD